MLMIIPIEVYEEKDKKASPTDSQNILESAEIEQPSKLQLVKIQH